MKAIKLFFVAMAVSFAMNANAQFANQKAGGSSYGATSSSFDSRIHGVFDLRVGSFCGKGGFGATLGIQKGIYQYKGCDLAWDIAHFEFSAPFKSPSKADILGLKTGVRCFSPSFANDKLRLYTNISMGYICNLSKGIDFDYDGDYDDYDGGYPWYISKGKYPSSTRAGHSDWEDYEDDYNKMKAKHGFGLTWGIGAQYNKKFSIGYSLLYDTVSKKTSHYATISYTF